MTGTVLILGASSAIARACAAAFAGQGYPLYLAGRDPDELQRLAADLQIRHGIEVRYGQLAAGDTAAHAALLASAVGAGGTLAGVVLAFGRLGDQRAAERDFRLADAIIGTNYTGAVSILSHCANRLEAQGTGFIIGLSSVAGDRGRQSNYLYGSAKGALSLYLQGLRNRLQPHNVRVITVKPGFVDTAMTFGMPGMFLVASPAYVGRRIVRALKRPADTVYVPWFWRYIMLVIKLIPEFVFKRMKL